MRRNVYDFDKTIYAGDATADFHRRCCLRHPRAGLDIFASCWYFLAMWLGLLPKTLAKQRFYRFLRFVPDVQAEVLDFWAGRAHKIRRWYLESREEQDLIISASPEFLLKPICETLRVRLIASRVDPRSGVCEGANCHGKEKLRRLREALPDTQIGRFCSDSLSDTPLAAAAEEAFLVRGERLLPWPGARAQSPSPRRMR
ncbi:MAG: haloacid dehalogenase-like hydrolase [Clostridia bacterium]|nr:haloacid dehalogenase-like hydrolase [Clostridia bacterium]